LRQGGPTGGFLVLLALAALAFFGLLGVRSRFLFGAGQDVPAVPHLSAETDSRVGRVLRTWPG